MNASTLTKTRHERYTSNFGQFEEECGGVAKLVIPLPAVLMAYMTIHAQFRYPRILRVNSDTKALQSKLSSLLRDREPLLAGGSDSVTAMERKKAAAAKAALDYLKIGACLYAPFSGYHSSAHIFQSHAESRGGEAGGVANKSYSDLSWVGDRRSAA